MPALIVSPALPPEQEETKDRSSIKLMDLPMTKKKNPVLEDTTATGAGGVTSTATASTVPANTKQAASKQQQPSKSLPTIQASQKTTNTSSSSSELTFTEDSSFSEGQDQLDPDQDQDDQTPRHRVGNPPHYETREERQIRIRRQFNQLDGKRSGYVDANSLVSFFAEVTPDVNVQKRYADELLQLCHTRKLHRNSGVNNSNSSNKDVSSSSGTEASLSGAGSADQEELNPKRHNGLVHYADFQIFVEEKEERLWNLFREIDHNNDNEIQADELQASLAKAGIDLSDADLQQFIKAMDKDGDGAIDYEEWRDFLVLLPREPTLKEIFNYVQEVVAQVGVDGDVVMPPSENDYVARYLLAGAIAGAVSRTVTAPLDRLKVYLITNSTPALTGPAASTALKHIPKFTSPSSAVAAPVRQRLLWSAITDLYQAGGIKTFFRGNGLNIIKIAPESAIKFYTYETSKWFIATHLSSLTVQPIGRSGSSSSKGTAHVPEIATSGRFLAGGIAGLVSQFSIYPLETIKTRIMASTGGVKGSSSSGVPVKLCIRTVAREMWQKAGIRGFYRGLGPSLIGIFPYAAIDLSVFETLKFGYLRWKAGLQEGAAGSEEKSLERPSVFVLLACGTISGSVGATSVYPLSLVRTRLQAQGTPQHPQTYTSTLDVFRKTFEKDGIRGFYKGMVPTLTKVVPAVSISYVVYEYSKRELGL
ncbi:hypothetical protein CPC16_002273 [Podila verticillata]|nr:hypothetical protein BGZ59_000863 [Podila verticillata]KAF9372726.1 hypothetical protein CPC16_002273 [Podila verticillata]